MLSRRLLWSLVAILVVTIVLGGIGVVVGLWVLQTRNVSVTAQLLVFGADARLRLIEGAGQERVVASDHNDDVFRYPAIAPNGRSIAYIAQQDGDTTLIRLDLQSGERRELYRSSNDPPLYVSWSPDGQTISFLTTLQAGGLGVHVVAADGTGGADLVTMTQGSSYFAWKPDGSTLLMHTGGSSFENGVVETYRPGTPQPQPIFRDPGFFQAPAWSRDGRSLYYVAQPPVAGQPTLDQIESVLTRTDASGNGATVLAKEPQAALYFGRSPTNESIAYTTVNPEGYGALKLVDEAGQVRTISRPDQSVPAFFWSPDGRTIAFVSITSMQPLSYQWHTVASSGGEVRDLGASFAPSRAFVGLVSYFDAYAMSFSLWSPDSNRLSYAADDGVYIIDVPSGAATRSGEGVLGVWVVAR